MAIEKYPLNPIQSPINRAERLRILENWNRITSYFNSIQSQIKFLAGGEEIDDIIERVNDAVTDAQDVTVDARLTLTEISTALGQLNTVISSADIATIRANDAADDANTLNITLTRLHTELEVLQSDLNGIVQSESLRKTNEITRSSNEQSRITVETAREANEAVRITNETNRNTTFDVKVSEANQVIEDGNNLVATSIHRRVYSATTFYYKNNEVLYGGSTYRCMQDGIGVTPVEGANWTLVSRKGVDGTGAVATVNEKAPNSDGNVEIGVPEITGLQDTLNDIQTFIKKETFTATQGQTVFNLVEGEYMPNENRISAIAGGVEQSSPTNFTETSPTSVTFNEGMPGGTNVTITYYSKYLPIRTDVERRILELEHALLMVVAKEEGKGLSTNDYTDADQEKLRDIEEGAQVNTVTSVNGQTGAVTVQGFSGNYDDLSNRPSLFDGDYNSLDNKPDMFSGKYEDLSNKPTLFSGNYNDLTNKPVIPVTPEFTNILNDEITIYVSNTGLDTNNGLTTSTPLRTIAKAVELVKNLGAKKRVIQLAGANIFNETVILKEIHGSTLEINGTYNNRATVKGFIFENCSAHISVLHIDVMVKGSITAIEPYGAYIKYCDRVSLYYGTWQGMTHGVSASDSRVYVGTITFNNVIGSVIDTSRGSFVFVDGLLGSNPATSSSTYNAYSSIIMGNAGTITSTLAQWKSAGGQIFF